MFEKDCSYKATHSLETRKEESQRIRLKYPDRVAVIVEKSNARGSKDLPDIDKKKFLAPKDLSVGQFMYVIRKRIKLPPTSALFVFIDETLPNSSETLWGTYEKWGDEDGFLYMTYASENTFGEL